MRVLRGNHQKLIDQILKKEESLLNSDLPDYFRDLREQPGAEPELREGSAYEPGSGSDWEDSFDEDFDQKEERSEASESRSDQPSRSKSQRPSLKSRVVPSTKSKRDKYFKKGFDIKNLNFDMLILEKPVKEEKAAKKRKAESGAAKMKFSFLHEAYPQRTLLKNALTVEKVNIMNLESGKGLFGMGGPEALNSEALAENRDLEYRRVTRLDSETRTPTNCLMFPTHEKLAAFFGDIAEPRDRQLRSGLEGSAEKRFRSLAEYKERHEVDLQSRKQHIRKERVFCAALLQLLEEKRSRVKLE